ncbi:MAG: flagellar hook-length control protein FliK [Bryobacteraceae bacterium]
MKVQQSSKPVPSDSGKPAGTGKPGGESKFSKALKAKAVKPESADAGPLPPGEPPAPSPLVARGKVEQMDGPARARTVDAVAHEIQVHSRGDLREVNIQFDSKVLDGLEVRIRAEGGALAVQLITKTANAYDTVQGGVGQLTAALQSKGITAAVQVRAPKEPEHTPRDGRGGGQGGNSRGGRDQGGRR